MPEILPIAALSLACLIAATFDVAVRRIPNWLNLIILIGGLGYLMSLADLEGTLLHLAHFALALGASMLLFGLRMWGGGDAKFYSAVAVWFPLSQAPLLAAFTAVSGLALLIVVFVRSRLQGRPEHLRELPYGVAIACGALLVATFGLTR